MRVLLTNTSIAQRTGSELYVVELARALRARGHALVVFSPVLGDLARELAAASIPAVDDPSSLAEPPDLIHGHHHVETLIALLQFPGVPGLFVCHGWEPWEETPLLFPRLLRHVAVDQPTAERLAAAGVPSSRIETILNFVDLARFHRRPPLPPRPRRALVFSNHAHEGSHLPAVRAACASAGIELDVAGAASGRIAERPEELLPRYDLVFAKGRAALEALAVGAAVVLCDAAGCGPMVSTAEVERLRPLNFGFRTLDRPLSPEAVLAEIERYDAGDAARVSSWVREVASLDDAVHRYLALYELILAEHRAAGGAATADLAAESRTTAAYLRWFNLYLKEGTRSVADRQVLRQRVHALEADLERLLAKPPQSTDHESD